MSGCPDSLMGVSALSEPGTGVRSGRLWWSHERCLHVLTAFQRQAVTRSRRQPRWRCSSCPPSYTSWPSEDTLPLLCSSRVRVQHAPRVRGSMAAKHPHGTTAPPSLAGPSPSCMTVSVPPLPIYRSLLVFCSLSFLKCSLIRNTETKPIPWLV